MLSLRTTLILTKRQSATPGALSDAQQQIIVGILNYVQTITGLTFVAVDPTSGQVGDITFGTRSNVAVGESAITFTQIGQAGVGGDVWFNQGMDLSAFARTALHEIGHALGLKHPNSGADLLQMPPYLSSSENFLSYTVMTTGESNSNYASLPDPATF